MTRLSCAMALVAMLSGCEGSVEVGGVGPAAVAGPTLARLPDGEMPAAADPITVTTPVFYVAWKHPDLAVGDTIRGRLVAVDVGEAAPAGTEVSQAALPIGVAGGAAGAFNFSMPTAGWPPGSYRVEAFRNDTPFGTVDIRIQ